MNNKQTKALRAVKERRNAKPKDVIAALVALGAVSKGRGNITTLTFPKGSTLTVHLLHGAGRKEEFHPASLSFLRKILNEEGL